MTKINNVSTKLYTVDELHLFNEDSYDNAFNNWYDEQDEDSKVFSNIYAGFNQILEKFCSLINIEITEISYKLGDCYCEYDFFHDDDILEFRGLRLYKYLVNNCGSYFYKAKTYFKNNKLRTSHILFEQSNPCFLTGDQKDVNILFEIKRYIDKGGVKSFKDVIDNCLIEFLSACEDEISYTLSEEYFKPYCRENNIRFYENGSIYIEQAS